MIKLASSLAVVFASLISGYSAMSLGRRSCCEAALLVAVTHGFVTHFGSVIAERL
jgi:hypothetical protein